MQDGITNCMILPSILAAQRLIASLLAKDKGRFISPLVRFFASSNGGRNRENWIDSTRSSHWAFFFAVLYHQDLHQDAMSFWRETGDGISSRHAEHALAHFDFLESQCTDNAFSTKPKSPSESLDTNLPALPSTDTTDAEISKIKTLIAMSARSDHPAQGNIRQRDIFLYPKGLSGIYAVARSLVPEGPMARESRVVIYGQVNRPYFLHEVYFLIFRYDRWPYAETVKCVERSGWGHVTLYGKGTEEDLDDLERQLGRGERIQLLFCELPSNPQLASPDLHRIRRLADTYSFVVACDETLGTFANVDVLPYVDIAMTSLTKIFSGVSNVMGGSVIVNPHSSFYEAVHARLTSTWEDILFPEDIRILAANCGDFADRVRYCSHSALIVATLLWQHHLVAKVHYPAMVPTRHLYERYRRRNGGYGYVLSIVFHDPQCAIAFYDALDVCKGTSIGADFTLAVPYAQLAHFRELDLAESNGIPKHIVRISVGVDETSKLLDRVRNALASAENARHSTIHGHL